MRADAESLDLADVTGNWVNAEVLRGQVAERIAALADLDGTPLFFGRLDYLRPPGETAGAELPEEQESRYYIGRRHVHDAGGDPMVVDWRAPVSRPFYRASRSDPMNIRLRRRFGFTGGELTAYEDEHLCDPAGEPAAGRLLQAEIERPRVGPMRDIVATIQPEQDEIVRAGISGTVCVQGAPGTGKTAVGLHRVAYLLYAYRNRLSRGRTLVIGPNRSFLRYIGQVLPALGEMDVAQTTVDELVSNLVTITGTDTVETAWLKGDARMAEVLRHAVRSGISEPVEPVVVVRGSRRWRVPAYELKEIVAALAERDIRYAAARAALHQRIAHAVLVKMEAAGEAPDDRVQDAVARSRPVKDAVKSLWPAVDPAKVVLRLLSEPTFLASCAEGVLSGDEQKLLLWPRPPRGVRSTKWSAADAVLVDEAADLVRRTQSLGHVVLDEAQDLSPMQYRAAGRRCSTGSATVLGDLAQGTTPWATASWSVALRHLGKADAQVAQLTRGFRVPGEIIDYASRLLPHIAPDLTPATSAREAAGSLAIRAVPAAELATAVVAACVAALRNEGSVALIAAAARVPRLAAALDAAGIGYLDEDQETSPAGGEAPRLALVPAGGAKGLEYDYLIVDEPAAVVSGEADERTGLRRLYVVLTRAVSGLTIVHSAPLPTALGL